MNPPPPVLTLQTTLDGFTVLVPVRRVPDGLANGAVLVGFLAAVLVGCVAGFLAGGAVDAALGGWAGESVGLLVAVLLITLGAVLGMRLAERLSGWAEVVEPLTLAGQTLTLRDRSVHLSEILFVEEKHSGVQVVLRGGERLVVASEQPPEVCRWLRQALEDTLRPERGAPADVPAAVRALQATEPR